MLRDLFKGFGRSVLERPWAVWQGFGYPRPYTLNVQLGFRGLGFRDLGFRVWGVGFRV